MKSNIRLLFFMLLLSGMTYANQAVTGFCTTGGQKVVTVGTSSTNPVQASYPGCLVTVNNIGGGLATIFSDNSGTVLSNPFTANTLTGLWQFYAANGRYSVTLSNGTPSFPSPLTISDILLNDPATGSVTGSSFTANSFITSSANPAQTGIFRVASADVALCFRNSANLSDVCLKKAGAAGGNKPADLLDGTAFGGILVTQIFSNTANPSSTGVVACAAGDTCVAARNQGNSGDVSLLAKDSSDRAVVGGAAGLSTAGVNNTGNEVVAGTLGVTGNTTLTTETVNSLTVNSSAAPAITGTTLGDTAHRWDAFIRNLDVSGTFTIGGGIIATGAGTTNTIPKYTNGAGAVIGNSGLTDNGTTVSTTEALSAASLATTGTITGASITVTGLVQGGSANFGSGSLTAGAGGLTSLVVSGSSSLPLLNGRFGLDGTHYPLTVAGLQQAINDACTASSNQGGVVNAQGVIPVPAQTTGTEIWRVPCSCSVIGQGGQGTVLNLAPGTTSTIPVFRLAATLGLFAHFENMQIQSTGAATAGDAFLVDPGATQGQSFLTFRNVAVLSGAINGFDINTTGSPTFQAGWVLQDNEFQNGVKITNVADSFLALHNIFRTPSGSTHACLEATAISGASHLTIDKNNMQCDGGEILIHGAIQPKISQNQIEHVAGTNKPAIYLQADTATINGGAITDNNVNCHTNALDCIKLGSGVNIVSDTRIEGNTITPVSTAGGNGITITASGTKTKIGPNVVGAAGNLQVNDGGDHTTYFGNSSVLNRPGAFFFAPADGVAALTLQRNSATQSVPIIGVNDELGAGLWTVDQAGRLNAAAGSNSNPGLSFIAEPTSGWFRQQAAIFGFSIGGSYLTQFSTARVGYAPGVCVGWAPGAPNSNSDDNTFCRLGSGSMALGNGAGGLGNLKLNGVTFGANQTFTAPPQLWQSAHADNSVSLNSANTLITWTPLFSVTLKRIDATIQGVQANCTVAPKIRVTDGTTSSDLAIPNATTSFSATFTQNYNAVPLSINTVAGTCTTNPQGVNVTATFLSQ